MEQVQIWFNEKTSHVMVQTPNSGGDFVTRRRLEGYRIVSVENLANSYNQLIAEEKQFEEKNG